MVVMHCDDGRRFSEPILAFIPPSPSTCFKHSRLGERGAECSDPIVILIYASRCGPGVVTEYRTCGHLVLREATRNLVAR